MKKILLALMLAFVWISWTYANTPAGWSIDYDYVFFGSWTTTECDDYAPLVWLTPVSQWITTEAQMELTCWTNKTLAFLSSDASGGAIYYAEEFMSWDMGAIIYFFLWLTVVWTVIMIFKKFFWWNNSKGWKKTFWRRIKYKK
jgi:hypothetical protein